MLIIDILWPLITSQGISDRGSVLDPVGGGAYSTPKSPAVMARLLRTLDIPVRKISLILIRVTWQV